MGFDYQIFQLINNFAGRFIGLDAIAIFFAAFFQYVLVMGLVIFMLARKDAAMRFKNFKITAYFFTTAIISRFFFGEILKKIIARPRPFELHSVTQILPYDAGLSFPSGHMSFFFALSIVVFFYNKKAGIILFAGSFLMGLARIFVGIHYPLDILGGMILGILVGWGSYKIFQGKFKYN